MWSKLRITYTIFIILKINSTFRRLLNYERDILIVKCIFFLLQNVFEMFV